MGFVLVLVVPQGGKLGGAKTGGRERRNNYRPGYSRKLKRTTGRAFAIKGVAVKRKKKISLEGKITKYGSMEGSLIR